ncbi:DUF1496 domain-containing protein [Pseudoalteromonas sp.]|uniref:DUF1496 domain-containing protein n=1 Tax=Pseudoalteromonas sp. TaxID=53249 RepID=UPI003567C3A7
MRYLLIFALCFSGFIYLPISHANAIKTLSVVDASQFTQTPASCWYDNKRYSEGALIQVHAVTLICGTKDLANAESPLIWLKLDKQGKIIYPTKAAKITVH